MRGWGHAATSQASRGGNAVAQCPTACMGETHDAPRPSARTARASHTPSDGQVQVAASCPSRQNVAGSVCGIRPLDRRAGRGRSSTRRLPRRGTSKRPHLRRTQPRRPPWATDRCGCPLRWQRRQSSPSPTTGLTGDRSGRSSGTPARTAWPSLTRSRMARSSLPDVCRCVFRLVHVRPKVRYATVRCSKPADPFTAPQACPGPVWSGWRGRSPGRGRYRQSRTRWRTPKAPGALSVPSNRSTHRCRPAGGAPRR